MLDIDAGATIGLIKFFDSKKYAEDLLNGKLFCHESGWFRKLDDSFRGDKYDGKRPINVNGKLLQWGNINATASGVMSAGFVGDNKLPIYCLSIIDINILDKFQENTYLFKPCFVEKMKQFGKYAVLLTNYGEFVDDISEYATSKELALTNFRVEYVDIKKEYQIDDYNNTRSLKPFFTKDIEYEYQNEIRFLWQQKDGQPLIDSKNNSIMFDLKKQMKGTITSIDKLLTVPFVFSVKKQY
ncbi:MAG: hypothetical protein FWD40_08300 [Treponema sp.]|nr:hypothetical protein [Treponema sp.]